MIFGFIYMDIKFLIQSIVKIYKNFMILEFCAMAHNLWLVFFVKYLSLGFYLLSAFTREIVEACRTITEKNSHRLRNELYDNLNLCGILFGAAMLVSMTNFDLNLILLQTPLRFTNLENFNRYQFRVKQCRYLSYTNRENPYHQDL